MVVRLLGPRYHFNVHSPCVAGEKWVLSTASSYRPSFGCGCPLHAYFHFKSSRWWREFSSALPGCGDSLYRQEGCRSHVLLATDTMFGPSEKGFTYISRPHPMCGRRFPFILDTPVYTDQRNMDSTFREKLPKMVTFHENWDSPFKIDDPG